MNLNRGERVLGLISGFCNILGFKRTSDFLIKKVAKSIADRQIREAKMSEQKTGIIVREKL